MQYVKKCKNIDFNSVVEFQRCFCYELNGKIVYTPFEHVEDVNNYFKQTIIGELGTLLNYYCKTKKKKAFYKTETLDEAGDLFIYFLIYAMILDDDNELLNEIDKLWNNNINTIQSEKNLNDVLLNLVTDVFSLNDSANKNLVSRIFENIVMVACYITGESWQKIVDEFHFSTLNKHLDPKKYSLNFRFEGTGYVDFEKIINWMKLQISIGNLEVAPNILKIFEKYKETSVKLNMVDF